VVAALVDVRPDDAELETGVAALGARLDVVALARGRVTLPPDLPARAAALTTTALRSQTAVSEPAEPHVGAIVRVQEAQRVELRELGWPDGVPLGGPHGFTAADHPALAAALPGLADDLGVRSAERTLVLGTEELMQLPLRLAQVLADAGHDVAFSTTTRSPAVVVDQPDYALRSGLTFAAHDNPADGPGPRYAYNLGGSAEPPWDHVLVVVDPPADTPALRSGLLAALQPRTRRTTLVITP
jgi:hypothetical protein